MARKLSRIAEFEIIVLVSFAAAAFAPRAWGQSEVQVAPATKVVENPFAAKPRAAQPTVVPREANDEPKTFQNPFATRSAPPRVLTPMPNSGSLSRWRRPVELPGSRAASRNLHADEPRWDTLSPDALGEQFAPEPQTPAPQTQVTQTAPPDPIRFAPSSLHQPYWLLPVPTAGEEPAGAPASASQLPIALAPVAEAAPSDPFDAQDDAMVLVSDTPQATPGPRDPACCSAAADQAAAAASTIEELGSVVRLCQDGLAGRPQGEVARSLRTLAAWASNRRGEIKSDDRREDEALREFEIAIQYDPSCWLALHNRGVSRAQQGQADEALQDFNRAIQLNPGHAIAYRNRGELLAAMGRSDEAVADYSRALATLPDDPNLSLMRGHALHRLGRFHESLADLSRSIELAPRNAEAFAHRGNVFAELGEFARASKDFQQALRLDPDSPDAYRSLAWLMATCPDARFRDPQQALAAAERAANLAPPGDCFVLDALAAAHANAGHFDQAVRYQKEAVSAAPTDFQPSFADRLALYQRRRPFRNGIERTPDAAVRAASLETNARQQ
jgi:tetratricopeptide (TPR) repeat protein